MSRSVKWFTGLAPTWRAEVLASMGLRIHLLQQKRILYRVGVDWMRLLRRKKFCAQHRINTTRTEWIWMKQVSGLLETIQIHTFASIFAMEIRKILNYIFITMTYYFLSIKNYYFYYYLIFERNYFHERWQWQFKTFNIKISLLYPFWHNKEARQLLVSAQLLWLIRVFSFFLCSIEESENLQ